MKKEKKVIDKRFRTVNIGIILIFLVLSLQLINLQLVNADLYKKLSEGNRIRIIPIASPRGDFIDRYGKQIVTNRPGFTVSYLDMGNTAEEREHVFKLLRRILDIPHYISVDNEKYTVSSKRTIRLRQRPIGDKNNDGIIDEDDIVIRNQKGEIIHPIKVDISTCTIYLTSESGDEVFVDYVYDNLKNKVLEQGYKKFVPVKLKTDVNFDAVAQIEENDLPGVIIQTEPIRNYLYGESASHIVGYLGEINKGELEQFSEGNYKPGDNIGKEGLERVLEKHLRGRDGGRQVEVSAKGEFIRVLGQEESIPGDSIFLTIDLELQRTAEKALKDVMHKLQNDPYNPYPNANKGAVVAMNVKSGEILALVSEPAFNPNSFVGGISRSDWEQLNSPLKPLFNRAIQGTYPPGSVFKMVTVAAALETDSTTPDELINSRGGVYWTIAPKKCWAWRTGGHGRVNAVTALAKSCNIYFYEMGRRSGIDSIETYSRKFGLGEKTGIELSKEEPGIVAGRSYKEKAFKNASQKRWYPAETLDAAIGQGFHSYTPLQIVRYVSAIANDGKLVTPYLVKKVVNHDGEIVLENNPKTPKDIDISKETLDTIKKGMKAVLEPGGTAWAPFINFPITAAGKTGTAEWNSRYDNHGWFASFAPYDDPEIAVVVFIEQAGSGGSTGGPVARAIFEQYFELNKQQIDDYLIKP
ncbi:MAG TPA: penicillin-binding protein 2 [Thermoanaerobacterales bacterium]|nr:penicillin-binding protein 2 [Thermoanaerobacterales bacterium]